MNKLISKIVGVCLGLSLATGVGVGVAMGQDAKEAKADSIVYTFDTVADNKKTDYTKTYDVTIGSMLWNVPGNQSTDGEVRIGGKSLSNVDRVLFAKSSMNYSISGIKMYFGAQGGSSGATITVNSITMSVHSSAAHAQEGTSALETKTFTYAASSDSTVSPTSGTWDSRYYRFEFNVSNSKNNNAYFSLASIEFIGTGSGGETGTELSDEIVLATTGRTGNSYGDWSNKQASNEGHSDAIYAGQSAGGNNAIQLRSQSPSGLVSTASGGKLESVEVIWNANTTNGRTIDIYGKSTAYESGADLYVNADQGSKLGSIVNGTSTSYTVTAGEYNYVGIRSSGNALYLDKIVIKWLADDGTKTLESLEVTTLPTKSSYAVGEQLDLTGIVVTASYEEAEVDPTQTVEYTTSPAEGYVFTAADATAGSKTITVTSTEDSSITTTFDVTVTAAAPKTLYWGNKSLIFAQGTPMTDVFTSEQNTISIRYTDNTDVAVTLSDVTLKLGDDDITSSYVLATADNGKRLTVFFTDVGRTVSYYQTITVQEILGIRTVEANFADDKAYLLVGDDESTLNADYFSFYGKPTLTVTTSNDSVIDVDPSDNTITEPNDSHIGSIEVVLDARSAGIASITIEISINGRTETTTYGPILVRESDPASGDSHYEKVTSTSEITDGQYLIVYEAGLVAMDGGLSSFDAVSNTIDVTITNDEIPYSVTTAAAEFTIDASEGSIQGASGKYVSVTSYSNSLVTSDTAVSLNIDIEEENALITKTFPGGTVTLKYNDASGQTRFRFYKSGQKDIQLYKLVEEEAGSDFDKALEFVNTFMHTEVPVTDEGSGKCISEGWYTAAKTAFINESHSTTIGYLQNAAQRAIVADNFSDYFARLQAWAAANGEVFELSNGDYVVSTQSAYMFPTINNDSNAAVTAILVVMALTVTTAGAYFFLRKKKEEK